MFPFRSSSSSDTSTVINPFGTSSTTSTAITNRTDQSTTTITDSTLTLAPSHSDGIYEDHPGLINPPSENIVERQSAIREKVEELMLGAEAEVPEDIILAVAEELHGESNNAEFLQDILDNLNRAGTADADFQNAFQKFFIRSPLEQFEILPLIPMKLGDLYFSFTNPSLFMLLTLSFFLLFVHFVTKKGGGKSVPNAWQSLVELIYDFVPNLVKEQIGGLSGNVKEKFFPCISVTFTFSLFRNLQGMIPYSFTVTSHFLITLGLSFSLFIGITIVGFQKNGLHFLSFSLPAGVPLPLAPFLVLLELIPHCFRALSLGIRLFANMMAGHSSVKILSGSAWTMLCMNDLFYFIGDPGPLFIVLALTGLELGVAISQAHVSTISICIYLNDAINLHQSAYLFIIEQKRGIYL
ncbi:ATP synthase subunit a-like [Andrographis paniculata]|uniref:ATP synthase subunit a-like n=1 Tax=Andrographis paniculata TaxID=175694 RepID=UPI0021E6E1D4|nr:ATP synthase subunit a-like [Andrographis paniculata]XP_051115582.1 ATP synthase subunit a-like [Andrographis paniculata]